MAMDHWRISDFPLCCLLHLHTKHSDADKRAVVQQLSVWDFRVRVVIVVVAAALSPADRRGGKTSLNVLLYVRRT